MRYDELRPRTRTELDADVNSGDPATIATALRSAALYDADRAYVEDLIVRLIRHRELWVRGVSASAAGHAARIHRTLSTDKIVPLIEALLENPQTRGKVEDALDDIQTFLGEANLRR